LSVDKRQEARMNLNLPVRVGGITPAGEAWEEMTTSADASRHGASFVLTRVVEKGEIVQLTLPLPKNFRAYDINEASYRVYALVRNVHRIDPTVHQVGVLFLGRSAPRDYAQNPGMRYLLPSDPAPAAKDRRREERRTVFVTLRLAKGDSHELTVAEDLSRGGARVPTSLALKKGEYVNVEELGGAFRLRAEIRNVFEGPDKVQRLNLQFVDGAVPESLLG
jgi:hypothetical protein